MKKLFTLAVLVLSMVAATATAQVKFGVKGGLNVTNMSLNKDVLDAENRAGWFIGPTIKVSLPLTGLSIDAAALYDQRSAKIKYSDDFQTGTTTAVGGTHKQQSIQIPVNVRYGVGLGSMASVFAFAGPQFGFNVGSDETAWEWKKSNLSVNVGLGVSLINHLQVTANYNIACGTTGEATVGSVASSTVKAKNNAWQIGVAYFF